jgi:hypothetical protein
LDLVRIDDFHGWYWFGLTLSRHSSLPIPDFWDVILVQLNHFTLVLVVFVVVSGLGWMELDCDSTLPLSSP